ncbi:carbohydrate kinase family protein [Paenibacillus cymbidii]|uniref:carbohydrate kinase family protein n=1 Tax=Paenibacillus cymbidii TaxID=1639034 RepID=UPI001081D176|nr:sugar kinase [Paenibacillus cymbidii]
MGKRVYILGELNIDLIATGRDVMPEWNREKLLDSFDMALGSSSAITASVLAGLGADVAMVSVVGDDAFGRYCLERLAANGVDTAHVRVDPQQQTGVTLSLSTAKDRALLTHMGAISELRPADVPDAMWTEAAHVHFGSYYLQDGMRGSWRDLFAAARERGITTSFDTGWDIREGWDAERIRALLAVTDWFVPSEDELLAICAAETLEQALATLPAARGMVAVKRGSRGAALVAPDGTRLDAAPLRANPVDTTGAGDSFNAGLIYGRLAGMADAELLRFAGACGAMATERIGGAQAVPSLADVRRFIAERST